VTTSPPGAPLLSIRNLTSRYGDVVAVDDVSLDIRDNEFFALLGPSGCGKTTLLRSIAGFEAPSAGEILLDGEPLLPVPAHRRPVNLMFQSYALFPHMSVEKNIAYGLQSEGLPRDEIADRVADVLRTVGLTDLARRRPGSLSGGQRQRVALARAIVKRPRLLLLDEPLSALDRKVRAEMQLELKRLQHEVGLTFVVVTHDQDEAMSMADRIAVLDGGRLQQVATPQELYERPRTWFVADFIGTANLLDGTTTTTGAALEVGDVPVPHDLPVGVPCTVVVRPEDVRLGRPDAGLPAVVRDSFFLGGTTTIQLDGPRPDGTTQRYVCAVHSSAAPSRGTEVGVSWDPARAVVVPRTGAAARPQAAGSSSAPATTEASAPSGAVSA
jgi:spermidine/putrescine ABC transporter ATP-binding subunit